MNETISKPWKEALCAAVAVPLAIYVIFVFGDAFRCGPGHAYIIGLVSVLLVVPVVLVALAAAAVVVWIWPASRFRLRAWLAACCLFGSLGVAGCIALLVGTLQDPTFCNISL
jgi:hypothetical protein